MVVQSAARLRRLACVGTSIASLRTIAFALTMAGFCSTAAPLLAQSPAAEAPSVSPSVPELSRGAASPNWSGLPVQARGVSRATVLSLPQCEKLAVRHFPKVLEARARLRRIRQELREAHTAPYSDFRGTAGISLPPSRRGNQIYSLDDNQELGNDNKLSWTTSISGLVPIYTFGKITSLWDAAGAQVSYAGHDVVKAQNEVLMSVREAFYGWQFARDALQLVDEAIGRVEGFEADLVERVDEGDAEPGDLYRLQLQLMDLRARRSEAQSKREIARASLAFLVGRTADEVAIASDGLRPRAGSLGTLEYYQQQAVQQRPELKMARAGLRGRKAQLAQASAALYPDIGVGVSVDWSYAPGITQQRNPFIANLGNGRGFSAAVGLRWKMDFLPQLARVEQARARVAEVEATAQYASGGIAVEVTEAYRQAEHAHRQLEFFSNAAKVARKWLVSTEQGIAIGAYESSQLAAPAKEYALKRFAEMNATYDYNLAVSRLALAAGGTSLTPVAAVAEQPPVAAP